MKTHCVFNLLYIKELWLLPKRKEWTSEVNLQNLYYLCVKPFHPPSRIRIEEQKKGKKVFRWGNEEVPLRTLDQQAEIRGHLFHNIAASWFPKAGAFAQKVQADIWAAAKAFPR